MHSIVFSSFARWWPCMFNLGPNYDIKLVIYSFPISIISQQTLPSAPELLPVRLVGSPEGHSINHHESPLRIILDHDEPFITYHDFPIMMGKRMHHIIMTYNGLYMSIVLVLNHCANNCQLQYTTISTIVFTITVNQ